MQKPHIPVYFGGFSETAIQAAGKHADIYALFGETWAQVREQVEQVRAAKSARYGFMRGGQPSEGSLRLLATAELGTVDQVADSVLYYYDLGVTTFFIRGFEPLEDAVAYGELINRTHEFVAERDGSRIAAE